MGMKTNASESLIISKGVPGPGLYNPNSNAFSTIAFSYKISLIIKIKNLNSNAKQRQSSKRKPNWWCPAKADKL